MIPTGDYHEILTPLNCIKARRSIQAMSGEGGLLPSDDEDEAEEIGGL